VVPDPHPVAESDVGTDHSEGADLHPGTEPGTGIDQGGRMDPGHHASPLSLLIMAWSTASQTRVSSTNALPLIRQIVPRRCSMSSSKRIWSPGTTGLRNRALSMVMKKTLRSPMVFPACWQREKAAGLGHCLDDENAGHDREPREVPGEEGFVDRDILDGHHLVALDGHHPVDEQERVAVGDCLHDLVDVVLHDSATSPVLSNARRGLGRCETLLQFDESPAHLRQLLEDRLAFQEIAVALGAKAGDRGAGLDLSQ